MGSEMCIRDRTYRTHAEQMSRPWVMVFPFGAILDVPYGRLAEAESSRRIMNAVIDEVYGVMQAAGHATHWADPTAFKRVFYERLVPDTAEHLASTLQDIRARKRTEIDALNGAVLDLAGQHGLSVPFNEAIWNLVKFIESSDRP